MFALAGSVHMQSAGRWRMSTAHGTGVRRCAVLCGSYEITGHDMMETRRNSTLSFQVDGTTLKRTETALAEV